MASTDIDDYLAGIAEPKRGTLEEMRRRILAVIPQAEECISYSFPAFKVQGKTVAGLAAFTHHLSYLPHSGSVLAEMGEALNGYEQTKGSLHFAIDAPLPQTLINALIAVRLEQLGLE
jgi:uncharacterized protein YdhG (YjbR/CyaY superfamily)